MLLSWTSVTQQDSSAQCCSVFHCSLYQVAAFLFLLRTPISQFAFRPPVVMDLHLTQNTLTKTGAVFIAPKCISQLDKEEMTPGPP